MNAFLWSCAKPVAVTAPLVALAIIATRPGTRRALWSLRARLTAWDGTSDDAITPAGGDQWEDVQSSMAQAIAEAPAREMGVHIDDADEYELAELAEATWPDAEYSEIIRRERRVWRRAVRRLRRRSGVAS